jgi:hypothetical protein
VLAFAGFVVHLAVVVTPIGDARAGRAWLITFAAQAIGLKGQNV